MRRLLANPNDSLRQKISSRQTFLQKEQSNHLYTKTESSLEKLKSPCLGSQVAPAYKLESPCAWTLPCHHPKQGKQGILGLLFSTWSLKYKHHSGKRHKIVYLLIFMLFRHVITPQTPLPTCAKKDRPLNFLSWVCHRAKQANISLLPFFKSSGPH